VWRAWTLCRFCGCQVFRLPQQALLPVLRQGPQYHDVPLQASAHQAQQALHAGTDVAASQGGLWVCHALCCLILACGLTPCRIAPGHGCTVDAGIGSDTVLSALRKREQGGRCERPATNLLPLVTLLLYSFVVQLTS
jgi:hypothetical protein